jgi:ABC-type lipoprotein release transport system permease subunit
VYKASLESQEENFVYGGRSNIQSLLKMGSMVSEIAVAGHDYRSVDDLLTIIRDASPQDSEALPWMELESYLFSMMNMMDGFVLVWIIVIFIALSFGLINTLMMAVFERIREIGLMQALGMRPSSILYLILMESLLLLALGLLAGNILAIASILPLKEGIDLSAVAKGMEMMGAGSMLYPALKMRDLATANVVVIVLGLLTSLLPAWHASRYSPVEAITKI